MKKDRRDHPHVKWLFNNRDILKISEVERKIGVPRSTIAQFFLTGKIEDERLERLISLVERVRRLPE